VSSELEGIADLLDFIGRAKHKAATAIGVIVIVSLVVLLSPYLCVDSVRTKQVLGQQGYSDIVTGGYGWFACGDDDFYSTRFSAVSPSGHRVAGVVCSGLFLKASTIRFDSEPQA